MMFGAAALEGFHRYADGLPIFVWTQQPDGHVDWANRAWYDFVGLPASIATTPDGWTAVVHPDDLPGVVAAFARAIEHQRVYEIEHRVKPAGADATAYRWILARSTPQYDDSGALRYWLGTGTDIHDARVRAAERQALIAELLEQKAESFRTIADNVPQMMWSARADGWIDWYNRRWFEYTGQTPAQADGWGWQAVHHPEDLPTVMNAWPTAIATRQPFTMEFRLRGSDGQFRMFLTRATPVFDSRRALTRWYGTNTDIDDEYTLRMRERRIAQTFQDAALQSQLPRVAGVALDAIYTPGQSDALVGGDWYDVFRLLDGRVVFSVGDVAGSGLNAAVAMGSLRQSIRTAALIHADPVAVLDAVDRIVRDINPDLIATAFVAVYDPVHAELRYASAGHPAPLLRRDDGSVTTLSHIALPLGLRQRTFESARYVQIEPGMLLVMYTDGLTEFGRDPIAGEERVVTSLQRLDATAHPARDIYNAVIDADGPHDDIAILTAYFSGEAAPAAAGQAIYRWTFDATNAQRAALIRRELAALLQRWGLRPDDVTNAEHVFAELVGNALRLSSQTVRIALDCTGESPVLHVLDEGTGFKHDPALPSDLYAEHGRGLYIVSHLTREFSISRRTGGGSHLRAVLSGYVRGR